MPETAPHVIVVDDDESLRRALARTIRLAGFDVATFGSAEDLLAHGPPEHDTCLVLDINLPGLGGIALKHTLNVAGCRVRTVFITAMGPAEVEVPLAELAHVTVLHKPFTNEALIHAIRHAAS